MSKEQKIEMKNANIKSTQVHHTEVKDMEFEYSENTNANSGGRDYSETEDDDVHELVSEVEITKLVSLGYFDSQ